MRDLVKSTQDPTSNKLVFLSLSKHMGRRAMSYPNAYQGNIERLILHICENQENRSMLKGRRINIGNDPVIY